MLGNHCSESCTSSIFLGEALGGCETCTCWPDHKTQPKTSAGVRPYWGYTVSLIELSVHMWLIPFAENCRKYIWQPSWKIALILHCSPGNPCRWCKQISCKKVMFITLLYFCLQVIQSETSSNWKRICSSKFFFIITFFSVISMSVSFVYTAPASPIFSLLSIGILVLFWFESTSLVHWNASVPLLLYLLLKKLL